MSSIDQVFMENLLYETAILHTNEKLVNVFQNDDKKARKAIVITNKRVLVFDVSEKEQEIILNEKIKIFNLDNDFSITTLNHFLKTELILVDTTSKAIIQKIDKGEADKIKEIIKSLKVSNTTQKKIDDIINEQMRKHDWSSANFQNHNHTRHEKSYRNNKTHSKRHHQLIFKDKPVNFQKTYKYCTNCGTGYDSQESSCNNCGELFAMKRDLEKAVGQETYKFCPYCNTKLYESDLYCSECGMRVI